MAKTEKSSRNRRRSNADGSVYKVKGKNGGVRYRWTITLGFDKDGKQIRRGGTCLTKAEADDASRDAKTRLVQRKIAMPRDVTLGAFIDLWMHDQQPHIAESTYDQRLIYLKGYVPQALKNRQLQSIGYRDLVNLDRELIDRGLMASTRRKAISILKMIFKAAHQQEIIAVNPSANLIVKTTTREEQARPKKKILEPEELGRFMAQARTHQNFGVLYSLFALGLRRGEALGIRWSDIHLELRTIQISQQVRLVGNRAEIGPLKTTNSRRTVVFTPAMVDVLEAQRRRQEAWKATCGELWTDSGLVFTTQVGTMIHPKNVNNSILHLCNQLGMRPFSSHVGRHTYISALLSRNEPLDLVAAVVGHKNSNITREVYRHHFASERREIIFDLEQFIAPAPK